MIHTIKRKSTEDIIVDVFSYLFLTLYGLIVLLPVLNVLFKSISEDWAVTSGKVGLWPVGFQLNTLKVVCSSSQFINSFMVSIALTILGSVAAVFITSITAYPLSKPDIPGKKVIMIMFIFTMLFSGGLIPNYLLIKNLHLLNKFGALILPSMLSVFNMLVIKNCFESIPESLEESAKLDGASSMRILFSIILPISKPTLATITLFYGVGYWNDYFNAMLYINKAALKPIQLYLRDILISAMDPMAIMNMDAEQRMNMSTEGVRSATVVASMVPMILVYPWLQKYFVKGVLIGSVKG